MTEMDGSDSLPVLGVLGGTFDPPHVAHVLMVTHARSRGLVDRMLVAPCWQHPLGKKMSPFASRLAWTRVAMAVHGPGVRVTDLERRLADEHGGPSYTLRLLEAVAERHPEHTVRLVIGSDIIATKEIERWHEHEELVERFCPIVLPRAGYEPEEPCALPEVSSTQVRAWLEAPDTEEARTGLAATVPKAVLDLLLGEPRGEIWLVGRGNVACHVEPWLAAQGFSPRSLGVRELLSGMVHLPGSTPRAVWLLCRDQDLPRVAQCLRGRLDPEVVVLHAAGALRARDDKALARLAAAGHKVATMHPICSLRAERHDVGLLDGALFGIEGDEEARDLAIELAGEDGFLDLADLGEKQRTAYHAACALAANHLAVLRQGAAEVLCRQRHPPERVNEALAALLRSALDNLLVLGVPDGITGPVARGDKITVAAHLDSLDPDTADLYRLLSDRLQNIVKG
jgi:nicotinate-nucleotide adenylyltransferase